jgi:hypothetical protein
LPGDLIVTFGFSRSRGVSGGGGGGVVGCGSGTSGTSGCGAAKRSGTVQYALVAALPAASNASTQ